MSSSGNDCASMKLEVEAADPLFKDSLRAGIGLEKGRTNRRGSASGIHSVGHGFDTKALVMDNAIMQNVQPRKSVGI